MRWWMESERIKEENAIMRKMYQLKLANVFRSWNWKEEK